MDCHSRQASFAMTSGKVAALEFGDTVATLSPRLQRGYKSVIA
jgi:hypothetical protein